MSPPPDTDDADMAAQAASQEIRKTLRWRINASTHPSRLINKIAFADLRCVESTRALARLIGRSPTVLKVIRAELHKAFEIDPDTLLFTEPKPPLVPEKVQTLTERALLLLVKPVVEINVNAFTVLSVKGEPSRRLSYTPLEVLQRVVEMRLSDRLARAHDTYWNTLAEGSWLTRRERWIELHAGLFADRAFISWQLNELSSAAMLMVQAVIDAPTAEARQRAGGHWANVHVSQLMWPGSPAEAIPGALHIYREGESAEALHVTYLPGVVRNFYEYPSFNDLQCGLLELDRERFHQLWQCMPLKRRNGLCSPAGLSSATGFACGPKIVGDALTQGTQMLLEGQWANEVACAFTINLAQVFSAEPPQSQSLEVAPFLRFMERTRKQLIGGVRLGAIRDSLLEWDHQRRHAEIIFASMPPGLAFLTVKHQVKRYEKGLVALLVPNDPAAQTPAYQDHLSLMSQLEIHTQALKTLIKEAPQRSLDLAFWAERPGGAGTPRRVSLFMNAQAEALRCEVQLQHRLKLLSTAHRDLMIEVIDQPLASKRPGSQTQVMSVAIGNDPDAFYPLHNVWVITTAAALSRPTRQLPVVLYAFGEEGGVLAFSGVDGLTRSLKASLGSRDDSVLWGCVEHDKRRDLRAHAARETLSVRYVDIPGKPALATLKKLLGTYDRLHKSSEDITRVFSEVKDAQLSRALLLTELEQQLKVPVNSALSRAQANIELLRKVALEAKKLPTWLTTATRAQRRHCRRVQKHYMSSAWALLARQEQRLPDLHTYARQALTARLYSEGIALEIDMDEPFIAMSGDIHGTYCDYEEACLLKDPKTRLPLSSACRAFSLMEVALQNLDPLASWTQYKLNRACLLRVPWPGFHVNHLRQIIASLDIGGRYGVLIKDSFYPPVSPDQSLSEGRMPELLNRVLRAGVDYHLFSAVQQGLSAQAQSVFSTAMAARTPQDLLKNQHELQLHVVHLVGHTLQHDRYVTGIVVVQDKHSQLCVVYWPQAPHAWLLTEYSSLEQATAELNRFGALPDNAKALARQVAAGWAFEATFDALFERNVFSLAKAKAGMFFVIGKWLLSRVTRAKHLEPSLSLDEIEAQVFEQIASNPKDWLAIVPRSNSDAQALLYHGHVQCLQRQTQAASYSNKALEEYRTRRLRDDSVSKIRMMLGVFFPIAGAFNDIVELYLAVRRYQRSGDPRDKRVLADTIKLSMVGLVMTFVPGPKRVGNVANAAIRSALPPALGRIRRWRGELSGVPRPVSSVKQLPALERFKVKSVPEGAVALKGLGEDGVYAKGGTLFMADGTHHYPVYRRNNEPFLRLKNQQVAGQDELILNIHESGEWLLGADAPQPVAGTSSGTLNPWRSPVSPPPDWWPPIVRTATENTILRSTSTTEHWTSWRIPAPDPRQVVSPAPGVFRVPGEAPGCSYNVARIAPPNVAFDHLTSGFYRLLPEGQQAPLNRIVFMTKNEPLASKAAVDIVRWTSTARHEQPLPMSFSAQGEWIPHAPLFDRPLAQSVGEAFPSMTIRDRDLTVIRMIELSGPEGSATATHLLNIRTTLDKWLPPLPARPGQTDDLLRMLRPVERGTGNFFIGYQGASPGFTRVDFQMRGLDPSLWIVKSRISPERRTVMMTAVEGGLLQRGFTVHQLDVKRPGSPSCELAATHPGSNSLYYVSVHWVEGGSIHLQKRLTDEWLNITIRRNSKNPAFLPVKTAMEEGRLVRIVAGIQWPTTGTVPPSIYFVKVSPS